MLEGVVMVGRVCSKWLVQVAIGLVQLVPPLKTASKDKHLDASAVERVAKGVFKDGCGTGATARTKVAVKDDGRLASCSLKQRWQAAVQLVVWNIDAGAHLSRLQGTSSHWHVCALVPDSRGLARQQSAPTRQTERERPSRVAPCT